MDTISGEFISTRRIRNTSPQLLCDGGRERKGGEKKESVWSNRFIHAVLWGGVTAVYIAKIIPVLGRDEHTCTHAETHMDEVNSGRMSGRDKRQEGSGDERIVRENDRGRSAVLSCICPLGLLLSSEPRVLNPSFESWPTAELVHTHTHAHTRACTQCWQSGLGNSLRTPRQPDTLPNTTLAHTHMHKHTQNSLFVGGGLSRTGTRDGRKVFCQGLLLNSQKRDTNTSLAAAAKQHSNWDTGYLLA